MVNFLTRKQHKAGQLEVFIRVRVSGFMFTSDPERFTSDILGTNLSCGTLADVPQHRDIFGGRQLNITDTG